MALVDRLVGLNQGTHCPQRAFHMGASARRRNRKPSHLPPVAASTDASAQALLVQVYA